MMKHTRTRSRLRRRVILCVCVVLWTTAFILSHIPAPQLPEVPASDKWLHFVGFFFLAGWFIWTLRAYRHPTLRRVVLVIITMAAYAAFDELTQPLFNRDRSAGDWLADVAGTVAAVAVCEGFLIVRAKIRSRSAFAKPPSS